MFLCPCSKQLHTRTYNIQRCPCGRNRGWTKVGRSSPFGPFVSVSHTSTVRTHVGYIYVYEMCIRVCVYLYVYEGDVRVFATTTGRPFARCTHTQLIPLCHLMYMIIRRGQQRHCHGVL